MGDPRVIPITDLDISGSGNRFIDSITETDMVYFLLNVGNGDAQLLMLPFRDGRRDLVVVDVGRFKVMRELIASLQQGGFISEPVEIDIAIATHPHRDHIAGMGSLLDFCKVHEFWDAGFDTGKPTYWEMRDKAEAVSRVCEPTSGYERLLKNVNFTVLAPSIALKHQFDSRGIEENNSSIVLMVEYPYIPTVQRQGERTPLHRRRGARLLLGADAQTASWAHVESDFPASKTRASRGAGETRQRREVDYLDADVLKVPHHGSKHGVNLEFVERVGPKYSLVSCAEGGGVHRFPHAIAQEILREARHRTAARGGDRPGDHKLGIHYTSDYIIDVSGAKLPLGSVAIVVGLGRNQLSVWRLGDGNAAGGLSDLGRAVKVK